MDTCAQPDPGAWACRDRELALGPRPLVMGILNVTPDSFSDGGQHAERDAAVQRAVQMLDEGADIIDIGGESTRPGADAVTADNEAARVVPVVEALLAARPEAVVSVDTSKAGVAQEALAAGARIVNDVTAGTFDDKLLAVTAASGAGLVLMHMQGTPRTMQHEPQYDDVVAEVTAYLSERRAAARAAGVRAASIVLDPGIGFGKTVTHNLQILGHIARFAALDAPVLIGLSRKSLIGNVTGRDVDQRLAGSVALMTYAVMKGAAIVRVHDVAASVDAAALLEAARRENADVDREQYRSGDGS